MKEYLRLLRFLKPYIGALILASLCMLFSTLFDGVSLTMIVPLADKVLTDKKIIIPTKLPSVLERFIQNINNTPASILLNTMAIVVLVLFIFKGIFNFLQGYLMSDIGQRLVRDMRAKVYSKIQNLSLEYFSQKRSGELVSRITNDVGLLENALSYGLTDLIYEGSKLLLFTFLIFFIHFRLAVISLVIFPLVSFPIIRIGKILKKLSYRSQEKMADINSLLYETISGARIVKSFCRENYEMERFNQHNQRYYKLMMKSIKRTLVLSPLTEFIGALAGIFVFLLAGREVILGKLSFGVFGLFLGSLLSLIRPFKKLSQVHALNQKAIAASNRIYEVLDAQPKVYDAKDAEVLGSIRESIVFENVWFSYSGEPVLKDINITVKIGEVVGIVGLSGSGKSTLVDMIPRFYDPQKGRILIDGKDIKKFKLSSLREKIGMVTQETILFNDTVKANIAYGKLSASDREIEEAASKANAKNFIEKLPQGYDTIIGDRGIRLSGGERQRIAIARAILKDPPIVILDEATSQLDSESERIVQEALQSLMVGRTVFIVTHRLSTVRDCDKIFVLDKGRIVEEGSHQELLKKDGLYKRLYQIQEHLIEI
ncbi:MAG: ABC transporter ATP-binding protein/permease [Candidatus Omnitrophica bacterium]|nr:ABC transporter ATP-binding protein/permease [Candidatus Omnitrophota bacterium]